MPKDLLAAPIKPAHGAHYLGFLARMHRHIWPDWYLEIGTNEGRSLAMAPGKSVAVDPQFVISEDVSRGKPQVHFYQLTSDDFFAQAPFKAIVDRFDMFFLDGLHRYEFLLRAIMSSEKLAKPDSIIVMHDCVPMSYAAAERSPRPDLTPSWVGDVWKLVPILKEYRPDLIIDIVDCQPSGLTIVTGLDAENTTLSQKYAEIKERYFEMTLSDFGESRLGDLLQMQSAGSKAIARFVGDT